jgi:hypothetical protein
MNEITAPTPWSIISPEMIKELDVEKLERLFALQERHTEKEAEKAFNSALADFQAEMPPVFKWRQESKGKYHYASYDDIMALARPILRKNGLAISCSQSETETALTIEMTVSHKEGHSRVTTYTTPKDGPIRTQDGRAVTSQAQAQASSNTYARRNCLCNALDIVVTDEDDNGQAASEARVDEDQANELHNLLGQFQDNGKTKAAFLKWAGSATVEELPASGFASYVKNLNAKIAKV